MPANPDLANILGDTDFDFEIFFFFDLFGSQISGLGPALAHPLGPSLSLGPPTWAQLGPTHWGACWYQLQPRGCPPVLSL